MELHISTYLSLSIYIYVCVCIDIDVNGFYNMCKCHNDILGHIWRMFEWKLFNEFMNLGYYWDRMIMVFGEKFPTDHHAHGFLTWLPLGMKCDNGGL